MQGLIEEEKLDSFDLPMFGPSLEEERSEVAREGSFQIELLEFLKSSEMFSKEEMAAISGSTSGKEAEAHKKTFAKAMRTTMENLLKYHFGEEVMEALFERYRETMAKKVIKSIDSTSKGEFLNIVLERK